MESGGQEGSGGIRWPRVPCSKKSLFHLLSPPLELEFGFAPELLCGADTNHWASNFSAPLYNFFVQCQVRCPIPKATHGQFFGNIHLQSGSAAEQCRILLMSKSGNKRDKRATFTSEKTKAWEVKLEEKNHGDLFFCHSTERPQDSVTVFCQKRLKMGWKAKMDFKVAPLGMDKPGFQKLNYNFTELLRGSCLAVVQWEWTNAQILYPKYQDSFSLPWHFLCFLRGGKYKSLK